jgi:O-antigen/teichoic acid export membrane protein
MPVNLDLKKLLKIESRDAFLYVLVTFITGLGSFLVVPLFWSKLTPTDFGIIAVTEIISGFTSIFLGLSLDSSLTRYFYVWKEEDRNSKIFTVWVFGWLISILIAVIFFFIFFILNNYISFSVAFYPFVIYGVLQSLFASFSNIPFATIRIMKLPVLYSKYRIITFIITLVLQLLLILWLNKGIHGYFYALIVSGVINTLILTFIMFKISRPKLELSIIRGQLFYALPLIPSNLLGYFSTYVDRIFLQQYSNMATLGIYSVGMKFAGLISQLHGALKLSYVPFLFHNVEQNAQNGKAAIDKMKEVYIFVLFFVGLCVCLFIKEYVYLTNQPSYLPIIAIVPSLVLISIISSLYLYFAPGILLSKKTGYLIYPSLIQMVVFVLIGYFTISTSQFNGIIVSKFLSAIAYLISAIVLSKFLYNWSNNYKPLIIYSLFFGLASYLQLNYSENSFWVRVSFDTIILLAYIMIFIINSKIFNLSKLWR